MNTLIMIIRLRGLSREFYFFFQFVKMLDVLEIISALIARVYIV